MAGGVLAQHAAAGAATAVVTATWAPDSHRADELADALAILGAGKPRMLGLADARVPDSAPGRLRLCDAPLDGVVEGIVEHIRAVKPQVIITHDAYGQLTGHPDHVRTHQATVIAFHAAGLEHRYPQAGAPWQPAALYTATHPHSGVGKLGGLLTAVGFPVKLLCSARLGRWIPLEPTWRPPEVFLCVMRAQRCSRIRFDCTVWVISLGVVELTGGWVSDPQEAQSAGKGSPPLTVLPHTLRMRDRERQQGRGALCGVTV